MKFEHVIGIDIAKLTFVWAIYGTSSEYEYSNDVKSIRRMLKTLKSSLKQI